MTNIFLGEPPASIEAWIIENFIPGPVPDLVSEPVEDQDVCFTVQTTSAYKKASIYST